jgi:hypothetical protein
MATAHLKTQRAISAKQVSHFPPICNQLFNTNSLFSKIAWSRMLIFDLEMQSENMEQEIDR